MQNPKFQLFKDRAGEFRFRLRARNGEIILKASEGYVSKQGAKNGISSVQTNSQLDSRYDKWQTASGNYRFNLKAGNGEIIGVSESYVSSSGRDNGIASVKRNAQTAPTEDLS